MENTTDCSYHRHTVNSEANSQLSTCSTFFLQLIAMNSGMLRLYFHMRTKQNKINKNCTPPRNYCLFIETKSTVALGEMELSRPVNSEQVSRSELWKLHRTLQQSCSSFRVKCKYLPSQLLVSNQSHMPCIYPFVLVLWPLSDCRIQRLLFLF